MTHTKLLEIRTKLKKRKPTFVVKESKFSSRIKGRWRYPRGKHSAVRQYHKGRPALPNPGYGSPRKVNGLHPSGREPVLVHTASDLALLDPAVHGAVISSNVGNRKRLELLKFAEQKRISVLNVLDSVQFAERITRKYQARKKAKRARLHEKSKKTEEKKKKAAEKKKEEEMKEKEAEKESVEDKVTKEVREQRELIEKTITKKQ